MKDFTREDVGHAIRVFRKHTGLSHKELAAESGVGIATIHNMESGKWMPTLGNLKRVTDAMNLSISYFFLKVEEGFK